MQRIAKDTGFKSIDNLVEDYNKATSQDNILILNTPPGRDGKIRQQDIEKLKPARILEYTLTG